jgi:hypothetical protein
MQHRDKICLQKIIKEFPILKKQIEDIGILDVVIEKLGK